MSNEVRWTTMHKCILGKYSVSSLLDTVPALRKSTSLFYLRAWGQEAVGSPGDQNANRIGEGHKVVYNSIWGLNLIAKAMFQDISGTKTESIYIQCPYQLLRIMREFHFTFLNLINICCVPDGSREYKGQQVSKPCLQRLSLARKKERLCQHALLRESPNTVSITEDRPWLCPRQQKHRSYKVELRKNQCLFLWTGSDGQNGGTMGTFCLHRISSLYQWLSFTSSVAWIFFHLFSSAR